MYVNEIKNILNKTYENCSYTLNLESNNNRGRTIYYYTIAKNWRDSILAVRDALNSQLTAEEIGHFTNLTQTLSGKKWELPQCACLYEYEGSWKLKFHNVTGVRYHRTFGKRVAASLILSNSPVITLSDEKRDTTFYGYWDGTKGSEQQVTTDGLNYKVNRNLRENPQFREFTIEFLLMIASEEGKYILKDVSRTISSSGCFLPSIPYRNLIEAHTPAELLEEYIPNPAKLNINLNKIDINISYIVSALTPFIRACDLPELIDMTPKLFEQCCSLKNLFDGLNSIESISQFIVNYYRYAKSIPEYAIVGFISDYVCMSIENEIPIQLSGDIERLRKAHDDLVIAISDKANKDREDDTTLVASPSKFDFLEMSLDLLDPGAFRRLRTVSELFAEGEYQHNCVITRKASIRCDRVAIFHWDYMDESCTVQFATDLRGRFYIEEIFARFNKPISSGARFAIRDILQSITVQQ